MRGDIINDNNLILMNSENIHRKYDNIYNYGENLSKGAIFLTNVRFVWYSYNNL